MSTTWPISPASSDLVSIMWLGHSITIHREAVNAFRLVELRARRSEYGTAFAGGLIGPTPTGAYNHRNRRPYPEQPVTVEHHSEHCHGHTIDVDYDSNPLSATGYLVTDFDRFGLQDGIDWLDCWLTPPDGLRELFRWGGGWTTSLRTASQNLARNGERIRDGVVDGMHLELVPSLAVVRAFDWKNALAKEVAVNKEIQAAIDFVSSVRKGLKPGAAQATPVGAGKRVASAVVKIEKAK